MDSRVEYFERTNNVLEVRYGSTNTKTLVSQEC